MSCFCVQFSDGSVQWARLRLCGHCAILSFWCSVYSVCAVFNNFVFGGMLIAWPLQRTWENLKDSIYSVKFFLVSVCKIKAFVVGHMEHTLQFGPFSLLIDIEVVPSPSIATRGLSGGL